MVQPRRSWCRRKSLGLHLDSSQKFVREKNGSKQLGRILRIPFDETCAGHQEMRKGALSLVFKILGHGHLAPHRRRDHRQQRQQRDQHLGGVEKAFDHEHWAH